MFKLSVRIASQREHEQYGIEGTDVAALIIVNGRVVAYTDDYGSSCLIEFDNGRRLAPWYQKRGSAGAEFAALTGESSNPASPLEAFMFLASRLVLDVGDA